MKPSSHDHIATVAIASLFLSVVIGCGKTDTTSETLDENPPQQSERQPTEEQKQKMLAAKDALFQELSGKLMAAMAEGGPESAIEICQKEALEITQRVSQEQGLKIGRTGVRLRNPNNQPPAWAKSMTDARVDEPTFKLLNNDTAVALLPIKLQPQCLMCHGPEEQIIPSVKEKLATLYPDDAATGFQMGELRGWFWIEMPTDSVPTPDAAASES